MSHGDHRDGPASVPSWPGAPDPRDEVSETRPPQLDEQHAARLAAIEQKQDRTRYACEVLHRLDPAGVSTSQVMAWLAAYGYGENDPEGQKRNRISEVVNDYKREHSLEATAAGTASTRASLPVLTPELLGVLDEQRRRAAVSPWSADRAAQLPDHRPTTSRPAGPDTAGEGSPARPDGALEYRTGGENSGDRTPDAADQSAGEASGRALPRPVAPAAAAPLAMPVPAAVDRTRPVDQGTHAVPDRTPPVHRMVRFGWQANVGPFLVLLGLAALLAGAAGYTADRLFHHRLLEIADWRVDAAVAVAGVALAALGAVLLRMAPRKQVTLRPLTPAARAWYLMFGLALAASADASFRVWHDVLKVSTWEAIAFFAVVEVGLLAAGLSMRAHLRQYGTPGPARALVWLLSAFGVLSALLVSGWPYGLWRAIGGPAASVLALHMALGVELRADGARERLGRFSQALRSVGEHLLSYVGAGTGEQTWIVIRRERAFARAARLASKSKLSRVAQWRLDRAITASGAGRDPEATAGLMSALAARRGSRALLTMPTVSPWDGWTWIEAPAVEREQRAAAKKGQKPGTDQTAVTTAGRRSTDTSAGHTPSADDRTRPTGTRTGRPDASPETPDQTTGHTSTVAQPDHPATVPDHIEEPQLDQPERPAAPAPGPVPAMPFPEPSTLQVSGRSRNWSSPWSGSPDHGEPFPAPVTPAQPATTGTRQDTPVGQNPTNAGPSGVPRTPTIPTAVSTTVPERWSGSDNTARQLAPARSGEGTDRRDGATALPTETDGNRVWLKVRGQDPADIAHMLAPIAAALSKENDFLSRADVTMVTDIKSSTTAGLVVKAVGDLFPEHPDPNGRRKPERARTIATTLNQMTGQAHLKPVR